MSATTSSTQTDFAPFGWYPDPANSGMLRWWNGRQWTDNLEYPRPEVQVTPGTSNIGAVLRRPTF
jgi:hypothetical protein